MASLKSFIKIMGETNMKAIIKDIKKDTTKSGKPFYRVTLESGETLFAWDYNVIRNVKKGEPAILTTRTGTDGRFIAIVSSRPADEDIEIESTDDAVEDDGDFLDDPKEEAKKPSTNISKDYMSKADWEAKDLRICRLAVIKAAVDYADACAPSTGSKLTEEEIVEIAKRFEEYAVTGK
jgi:hypothetical protein